MNEDDEVARAWASTVNERMFVRWVLASCGKATNPQAERALRDALRSWENGLPGLDSRDRDAWLSLVQLELLHVLAGLRRLDAAAAPLLLTRERWVSHALQEALAGVGPGGLADAAALPPRPALKSRRAPGLAPLGEDSTARAVSPDTLRFADDAGQLVLSGPVGVRWLDEQGDQQIVPLSVSSDARSAALALVGGLRTIDLLPLEPVRQRTARAMLLGLLGGLLLGRVEPEAAIVGAVHGLLSNAPALTPSQQAMERSVASWPPFTAVVGALDRFVGSAGAELSAPVEVGTWVAVDGGPIARWFDSAGVVIAVTPERGAWDDVLASELRNLLRYCGLTDRPAVLVQMPGGSRLIPVDCLRTPRCARLAEMPPTPGPPRRSS